MLLLTRPRSVADAIDISTELFSTEASSIQAVTGSSASGAGEQETRVKFLESKYDQLLKAVEKSGSKKGKPSNGEERDSAGPPTCWSCGEQGHV